ncbi:protein kinase domain-containing protein [Antrihabitans spumae]|uniref:non-specific serine/threonine protein kinase n=1 Tax=Antrihabitans spumae TaxID=3373370 RepID=A0ABW7KSL7_9NOCA
MPEGGDRWIEVSKSAFAHEAAGLEMLRKILPKAAPYRAWTNFEFMDNHGQWHEIDALVLGRRRLHLVELKSYSGELRGTESSWVRKTPGGKIRTQRSPLLVTRRKAQRLATRIEEEARKVAIAHGLNPEKVRRALPFVQESVFLHGSPFTTDLPELAKSSLFGPDGQEKTTGLPGISTRLLEPPTDSRRIDEDLSVIIALALRELGITRRTERDAGSWTITGTPLATGDDWQEWAATHKATQATGRARVVSFRKGTPDNTRAAAYRKIEREYSLLSSLRHESIVAPRDLVQDDDGNTVIVYADTPGYEPLDLALATRTLTAEQQLLILTQIADAVGYAHRNQVAHRGLGPSTVLIHTDDLDAGTVKIRLADWSWAGRVHSADTRSPTMLGTATSSSAPADDVYQAPEDRWAPDADRLALDVFSLGALAYFLLSGGQAPARDRPALLERLRQEQGLDLAASGGRFVDETLRKLVLQATQPSVTKRVETDKKTGRPGFGAQQFATALGDYRHRQQFAPTEQEADPLNPTPGALLNDRFEVVRVLGSGSTARGVLVIDRDHDDRLRVLKVGLDDSAVSRLRDEAEVLTRLAQQQPPVPGVVELIEGPLELAANRTALLLSNGGEQTLADVVRYTPLGEGQLRSWGLELLDSVVALDSAGITHRDIKPSNLGLSKPEGKSRAAKARLALFDFSLSRAPVDQLDAGTPPYRDPFLGTGLRMSFDSAAERYSAAVVLFEMATASTPAYGDGVSDPGVLHDEVTVTPEDFTAGGLSRTRAEALVQFFRIALARSAKSRFDTAAAMREAWAGVFKAHEADSTPRPEEPQPAKRREIAAPARTLDVPTVNVPTITSLSLLAAEFARAAGTKSTTIRRQVVELVLGAHGQSPEDPFVTYQILSPLANVTSGRIAQIFGEFSDLWDKNPQLIATVRELYKRLQNLLEASGGASTPDLLARELIGSMYSDDSSNPQRTALGVLRLLMASQPAPSDDGDADSSTDSTLHMVRRHGSGTVAMISTAAISRRLPAVLSLDAERIVAESSSQGSLLVSPAEAELPLRAATATVLDIAPSEVEIPGHVLLRIAAVGSKEVALSARDELHARELPIVESLRFLLRGLSRSDSFSRAELESRLTARFPALGKALPRRPDLDDVVFGLLPDMHWDGSASRYAFTESVDPASHVPTRHTRTATNQHREPGTTDIEFVLTSSVREHNFRALGIPLGASDAIASALVAQFGAQHIDVTDLLLNELRRRATEAGIDWSEILAADAGAAADRGNLKGFVSQAVPTLIETVSSEGSPVVLTDLTTLAAYGQLGVIHTWADLASPPKHAVWVLVPQREESGGLPGARVDGISLPLNSPEQFVQVRADEVAVLLASPAASQDSSSRLKEHI